MLFPSLAARPSLSFSLVFFFGEREGLAARLALPRLSNSAQNGTGEPGIFWGTCIMLIRAHQN